MVMACSKARLRRAIRLASTLGLACREMIRSGLRNPGSHRLHAASIRFASSGARVVRGKTRVLASAQSATTSVPERSSAPIRRNSMTRNARKVISVASDVSPPGGCGWPGVWLRNGLASNGSMDLCAASSGARRRAKVVFPAPVGPSIARYQPRTGGAATLMLAARLTAVSASMLPGCRAGYAGAPQLRWTRCSRGCCTTAAEGR